MENKDYDSSKFYSLVIPFYKEAMIQMGLTEHPYKKKFEPNFEEAKKMIDTLEFLKEKTEGNLLPEEESILEATLTLLKTEFLKLKKII